jgi:bifunctional DNA-binding transcriptional regulator/antitoxin component of YhaV-PrlF toxin-antitoxin module
MGMRNSNIMKLDSKGRLLIPVQMRKKLDAVEGTEVMLLSDEENREIRIVPLVKGRNAEIKILLTGIPESLAMVANTLASHKMNILVSESKTIVRGKMAQWDVIVDTSSGDLERLGDELKTSKFVKNVEIVRK